VLFTRFELTTHQLASSGFDQWRSTSCEADHDQVCVWLAVQCQQFWRPRSHFDILARPLNSLTVCNNWALIISVNAVKVLFMSVGCQCCRSRQIWSFAQYCWSAVQVTKCHGKLAVASPSVVSKRNVWIILEILNPKHTAVSIFWFENTASSCDFPSVGPCTRGEHFSYWECHLSWMEKWLTSLG
jgi:hypothetical protein